MIKNADRAKVVTTATGAGDFNVNVDGGSASLLSGFQEVVGPNSPAGLVAGDKVFYVIEHQNGVDWEVGYCPVKSDLTLERTHSDAIVFASSNNGSLVNFAVGNKFVYITFPAQEGMMPQTRLSQLGTAVQKVFYVFDDCVAHACGVYDIQGHVLEILSGGVLEIG